jgi:hypothetical protein
MFLQVSSSPIHIKQCHCNWPQYAVHRPHGQANSAGPETEAYVDGDDRIPSISHTEQLYLAGYLTALRLIEMVEISRYQTCARTCSGHRLSSDDNVVAGDLHRWYRMYFLDRETATCTAFAPASRRRFPAVAVDDQAGHARGRWIDRIYLSRKVLHLDEYVRVGVEPRWVTI